MKKIAFLIIGTNKYVDLACNCSKSIHNYVKLDNYSVETILFSNIRNGDTDTTFSEICHIEHLPWPLITLMRYHYFIKYQDLLEKYDYLYYIDADMEVISPVKNEIIGERVATQHPGLWGKRSFELPFERNNRSTACIEQSNYAKYYFGALQGGSKKEFLKMSHVLRDRINQDLKNNFITVWHDESQMNKYFFENPPTVVLNSDYAYVKSWNNSENPKIQAIEKNHEKYRDETVC